MLCWAVQVVELLVRYKELHDWQKALELVVPTRKRAGDEPDRQATRPRVDSGEGEGTRKDVDSKSGTVGESEGLDRNGNAEARQDDESRLNGDAVKGEGLDGACVVPAADSNGGFANGSSNGGEEHTEGLTKNRGELLTAETS